MKIKLILPVVLLLVSTAGYGYSRPEILYFQVRNSVAQPVTVRTDQGDFTFRNSYTFYPAGHVSRLEAFDANGNRIVNTQPQRKSIHTGTGSEPNEYWYVFSSVYDSDSGYGYSGSSGGYSSDNGNQFLDNLRGLNTIAYYSDDATNFQIRAGWGRLMNDNVTLKYCFGAMFIEGGLGKNIFSNDASSSRWTLGAGNRFVMDDFGDLSLSLDAAGDNDKNWCIVINAGATWWINYSRFGLYANLGLGLPYEPTIIFDVEHPFLDFQAGITIKLF